MTEISKKTSFNIVSNKKSFTVRVTGALEDFTLRCFFFCTHPYCVLKRAIFCTEICTKSAHLPNRYIRKKIHDSIHCHLMNFPSSFNVCLFCTDALKEWDARYIPPILEKGAVDEAKWMGFSHDEKVRRVVIRWFKTGRQCERRAVKRTTRKLTFENTDAKEQSSQGSLVVN